MKPVLTLLLFLLSVSPILAQNYTLTDLGLPPEGTGSSGKAINAAGQVTGEVRRGTHQSQAFLFRAGKMTELGTLDGFTDSVGNAINDRGIVAGVATRNDQANQTLIVHAFRAEGDALRDLGSPDQAVCVSSGINNSGQVVGDLITPDGHSRAFLYRDGKVTPLDDLTAAGSGWKLQQAAGINDSGDIVGCGLAGGALRAFLYHNGQVTDLNQTMSGQADWVLERADGINAKGEIVCIGTRAGTSHAFLYHEGRMTDLGALPDYPNLTEAHLNDLGQVVGQAESASGMQQCAFLYADGKLSDLNQTIPADKHWSLEEANGINDKGVIVGTGEMEGKGRAFLLTPKRK